MALNRALVLLLLAACTEKKEPPKPAVEASAPTMTKTTCEQGPWDDAARARHHATAKKLSVDDRIMDKVVDQGTRALNKEERAVFFTRQLLKELRYGGLYEFFTSSAGNCTLQTFAALLELGHAGLTNLFERALDKFGAEGPSEDRQTRLRQIDALPNAKNAWNETTQAMNRLDDVDAHLAKYMKAHDGALPK